MNSYDVWCLTESLEVDGMLIDVLYLRRFDNRRSQGVVHLGRFLPGTGGQVDKHPIKLAAGQFEFTDDELKINLQFANAEDIKLVVPLDADEMVKVDGLARGRFVPLMPYVVWDLQEYENSKIGPLDANSVYMDGLDKILFEKVGTKLKLNVIRFKTNPHIVELGSIADSTYRDGRKELLPIEITGKWSFAPDGLSKMITLYLPNGTVKELILDDNSIRLIPDSISLRTVVPLFGQEIHFLVPVNKSTKGRSSCVDLIATLH